ncbi:MAG: serine hydroxymethyltransferase [Phycisphaeraceae bacterium]|nr:serine hydroxymethyltransferase [Phycisphaeraceae bacterium]
MLVDRDARVIPHRRKVSSAEPIRPQVTPLNNRRYHLGATEQLERFDRQVFDLIEQEYSRQNETLQLIAAENICSRAVLGALGSVVQNKTTEGFVGARFHGGCDFVDALEQLAIERACQVFGARYANVQAHSGTSANHIVLTAVLNPGDRILSLGLDQGGHVSHGAGVSLTGKFFDITNYGVEPETYALDYDKILAKAQEVRPRMIICGASAYSRTLDFARFRAIADEVGAYLLADISHIAGLVAGGVHPSPIDHAHFVTTSTYKPGGPRGGLILMGRDFDQTGLCSSTQRPLWRQLDKNTFPGVQGTPYLNHVAGKAVFFKEMLTPVYRARQQAIVNNAQTLSHCLSQLGFDVLTGGTDTHMILIDVTHFAQGMTGLIAQKSLEQCGMIINMNRLPYDTLGQSVTSGIRLGTPIVTRNGMRPKEMSDIARWLHEALGSVEVTGPSSYAMDKTVVDGMRGHVKSLCQRFPMQ